MGSYTTELKVGIFTLTAIVIIGYMFFVLSPESFQGSNIATYHTVLKDAGGVVVKTHVKTNGVSVGKVQKIELGINETKIIFDIDESVKIPVASQVAIKEKGLLGDVFVEIIRADDTGNYLEPGSFLPPLKSQMSIQGLISLAGSIGGDVKKITKSLSQAFGSEQSSGDIATIIRDLKEAVSSVRNLVSAEKNSLKFFVTEFSQMTQTLNSLLQKNHGEVERSISSIFDIINNFKTFTSNLKDIVDEDNKERLNRVLISLDSISGNLIDTSDNLRHITDKVARGEGSLGRLVNDENALVQVEEAVKDVRRLLAPTTSATMTVDYHNEFKSDSNNQHYLNLMIRNRPDKFYLFGVTDLVESTKQVTKKTVNTENQEITTEKIKQDNALRFNAQFAKRWGRVQLRFGLFETTGGFASDFFFLDDKMRLSLEAFNWGTQNDIRDFAQFKAYLNTTFFDHIYTTAGFHDLTQFDSNGKIRTSPQLFLGAGIRFKDEDFRSLVGFSSLAP